MRWRTEDDELIQHLKRLPDFPMKPQSKNKLLRELVQMEQAIKPGSIRKVPMQRVLATTLASGAGLALFAAAIMGFGHLRAQRSNGVVPNTGTFKPPAPSHTILPTYFGYRVPFQPMIPTAMASGYKLTGSGILMTFTNGKTGFSNYFASYTKGKMPVSGRIESPPTIAIYEAYGNSITEYRPVLNEQISWTKLAQIKNRTYYTTKASFVHAVGFVKNNVIYAISEPMGGNLSQSTLLKFAESITKVAPVQSMDIVAKGYKNALENVTFHPLVPKVLNSTYKLSMALSQVLKTNKGTTQSITLNFEMINDRRKGFGVTEAPLDNADNQIIFPSGVVGYVPRWKDFKRGLEFSVGGNTSSKEFHRVLNLFRAK